MNGQTAPPGPNRPSAVRVDRRPVVITGGCGFIGTNLAHQLLSAGQPVIVYDNLSRPGVEKNLEWLQEVHERNLEVTIADIRDAGTLKRVIRKASHVYHLAAQVAVTTSVEDPASDFEINALGTVNVLEAVRTASNPPALVYTSSNKVYGDLRDLEIEENERRYVPKAEGGNSEGISEQRPLRFHSPYGCSKGAADQYVLDYARCYGLQTAVFRMSCVYGPHQFGTEDQGWVAHFIIRALEGSPIRLYGDGKQVRDILFVEDLVAALILARDSMPSIAGEAFNVGGGPRNTVSLLELIALIERLAARPVKVELDAWRPGDQRYYVSDVRKLGVATGWSPETGVEEGVQRLLGWLREERRFEDAAGTVVPIDMASREKGETGRPAPEDSEARGEARA